LADLTPQEIVIMTKRKTSRAKPDLFPSCPKCGDQLKKEDGKVDDRSKHRKKNLPLVPPN
jgi:hypothetical protein